MKVFHLKFESSTITFDSDFRFLLNFQWNRILIQCITIRARFGGWSTERGWLKSISYPLLGKNWSICEIFAAPEVPLEIFLQKHPKIAKNTKFDDLDKWNTSDFQESINDPTPGHPLKLNPDYNLCKYLISKW